MAFGIYVHIPYCIQRCRYCDFATYEKSSILPPLDYIELVKKEVQVYGPLFKDTVVSTVYFGGGTPSLVEAEGIVDILKSLKQVGLNLSSTAEITIEINPATVDEKKLEIYQKAGINRFSVGAQTFRDDILKSVGREHSAQDTRKTLELLSKNKLNYTFDLLFALPGQSLDDLGRDLDWVEHFSPHHISAYCLTVPEGHPLAKVRLPEQTQIEMFDVIEKRLFNQGLFRYEISNFAKPGFESKHNMIYWTDENFWGIGLSAHSYIKDDAWGKRFWNPNNIHEYTQRIRDLPNRQANSPVEFRDSQQFEVLVERQALTDFCHVFLRIKRGLSLGELESKFGSLRRKQVEDILWNLSKKGWLEKVDNLTKDQIQGDPSLRLESRWRLTEKGILISNLVFEAFTFLE